LVELVETIGQAGFHKFLYSLIIKTKIELKVKNIKNLNEKC